jgi:hypothetical protein
MGNPTKRLSLDDVKQLATSVALVEAPPLEVIAATSAGSDDSSEVLVARTDCPDVPCRLIVRVDRRADADTIRSTLRARFHAYLRDHQNEGWHGL